MNNSKNKLTFSGLLDRVFNKSNINKILIIFVVGLTSRILINNIYNINVFSDYFNKVSIIYYVLMSIFIVSIREVITYFNINIIPSFIFDSIKYVTFIDSKVFNNIKLRNFTISSINKKLKNVYFDNFTNKLSITQVNLNNSIDKSLSDNDLNTKVLSRSISSHENKSNSDSNSSSSANSNISRASNIRTNRISDNSRESIEYNNQNNTPNSVNSNSNDIFFSIGDLDSNIITNYNSPTPPMPNTPIPSNLTSPSISTGPSESKCFPNNIPPVDIYQQVNAPTTFYNKPINNINNSDDTNSTDINSCYRDSYRLQNITYVPNSYSSNYNTPNLTQPANISKPVSSTAPVTTPGPASTQDSNGLISSQPYQNLPDASQFTAAATYAPININSNQVPVTRALINNPRPAQSYLTSNNVD